MIRIDEIYENTFLPWVRKNLPTTSIFYCDPFGRSDPDSILCRGLPDSKDEDYAIFFFDQEPVQLNIQFDEPLLSDDRNDWLAGLSPHTKEFAKERSDEVFSPKLRGVLVVGHDRAGIDPGAISLFAKNLGWPLIAEDPLSFPDAVAHAALFLTDPELRVSLQPEQIIVIGRATLSRSISELIKECDEIIVIDPRVSTIDT